MFYLVHVLVPVVLVVVVNVIVYRLGWADRDKNAKCRSRALPPGWVIAVIWVLLFACLGYVHYLVRNRPVAAWAVVAFLAYAIVYPFATGGLQGGERARILNQVAAILAYGTAVLVAREAGQGRALLVLLPLLVWVSYVNLVPTPRCAYVNFEDSGKAP